MKEARDEWDISVALPYGSSPEILNFITQAGVRYEFIDACLQSSPAPTLGKKLRRQFQRIRSEFNTYRYLKQFDLRNTVVHIETPPWQAWIFLLALNLRKANIFVTMHNALPDTPRWRTVIWRLRMKFVSRFSGFHLFASNQDTKDKLERYVTPEFWRKIKVTYTCVNPDEINEALTAPFDREEDLRKHGLPTNDFLVLCVGNFIDRKGRWVFLEAAKLVKEKAANISFVWVSPISPTPEEQQRIAQLDLGERFHLVLSESIGQTHLDILKFFRIANVFALPSFVEGLPIALLEAMALAIPSISTRINGIPEAVIADETGILIEPGDSMALAEAILRLQSSEPFRNSVAERGREFVMEHFDERRASQIAINEYKKALMERAAA